MTEDLTVSELEWSSEQLATISSIIALIWLVLHMTVLYAVKYCSYSVSFVMNIVHFLGYIWKLDLFRSVGV
jgi:hypothetical protein